MKLLAVVAICLLGVAASGKEPLEITLYYESYCPGCIQYLGDQLIRAWSSFQDSIIIDLVPFGNGMHGPEECLANKLHACAILQACGETGTIRCAKDKLSHVLNYIHCVEQQPRQETATKKCATAESLDPDAIVKCAKSDVGDRLLNYYGNQTLALKPKLGYVPSVYINGEHDKSAEQDLVAEVCRLRPTLCSSPSVIKV